MTSCWRPVGGCVILVGGRPVHTGAYPSAAQNAEIATFAASREAPPLCARGRSAAGLMWGAAVAHTGMFPSTHECGYGGCPSWCEEAKNDRVCHAVIYREVNDCASAISPLPRAQTGAMS
jgi:hypothetical protein